MEKTNDWWKNQKQSQKNALMGLGLSIIVNYYLWYMSPMGSLLRYFGGSIFWNFVWFTLVGGGAAALIINGMQNSAKKVNKK